ncbi:MAG: hypothetical protein HY677_00975 [Chloroflexi bacterium]|nr:hypothetical protein [Chloroflexota bacterium]
MPPYRFQRDCRTPYSEVFIILDGDERIGRVDLHYGASVVYASLFVEEDAIDEPEVQSLIGLVDEDLVMPAEVIRDDFVVTVFRGHEVGVFSDEDMGDDEDEEEPGNGHRI